MIVRWLLLCTNKRIFASMSIAMINLQRQQPPLQTNLFSNLWGKRVHTLSRRGSISHFFLNTSPRKNFKRRYTCVYMYTSEKQFHCIELTLMPTFEFVLNRILKFLFTRLVCLSILRKFFKNYEIYEIQWEIVVYWQKG